MFGRKKRIAALEAKVTALREQFDEVCKYYSKQNAAKGMHVVALEETVNVHNKMRADEIRALRSMVEALEAKVAELEANRVPVISDLTGGGKKEKPVTAKQIMDEWFNGKAEGGEG
jgi:Asp-tRNA(Asn)/Glu-tRNA(Gln) amidotransferase C subunit